VALVDPYSATDYANSRNTNLQSEHEKL
jgi:hypothetical protein